jgi:peptidoglycan/xylan/chitin deacetylase (PgdA/CDA1 family)
MPPEGPLGNCWQVAQPFYALTFDDGPSDWTEAILNALAAHDCRATFFVLGSAVGSEARRLTLERIVEAGCELGNHTFSHPSIPALEPDAVERELGFCTAVIERTAGVTPRHWRAPYLRSTAAANAVAAELGLREVTASIVPADYEWPAERTAAYVVGRLRAGDIVCLHDGRAPNDPPDASLPTRESTVEATRSILQAATDLGLRSVTVAELLASVDA